MEDRLVQRFQYGTIASEVIAAQDKRILIAAISIAAMWQNTLLNTGEAHRDFVRQFLLRRDYLELHPFIYHFPGLSHLPFVAHSVDAGK